MKRSTYLVFALALAVACSGTVMAEGTSESSGTSSQPVELRFMIWDSTQRDTYELSIPKFEEKNPGIKINIEVAGWAQYWPKLQTEMAGGTAPDIFWNQIRYFPSLVENNVLLDLTPFIERDKIDLSKYDKTVLKIFQADDKIYTIAKDRDAIVLVYNKDLFDKVGLPYPDASMDWNPRDGGKLFEVAKRLTLDQSGNSAADPGFEPKRIVQYGIISDNRGQPFHWNFVLMNGGGVQREPLSREFLLDKPKTVEAMQFLADLVNVHHVAPPATTADYHPGQARQTFATGRLAMITDGSWVFKQFQETANFRWGVAPLPEGPEGRVSITNGIGETISADSKNKEESWTALKYFAGEENHRFFAEAGNVVTSLKSMESVYVDFWKSQGVDASPVIEMLSGKTALSPSTKGWNEIDASIKKHYDLLFLGQVDAQTAGNNIMADIQRILNN